MRARGWRWVIVVSLVLNLFLLGVAGAQNWPRVAGALGLPHRAAPFIGQLGDGALLGLVTALPLKDSLTLRRAFAEQRDRLRPLMARNNASIEALREAVARTPIDEDALRAALADLRQARLALADVLEPLLLAVVPALSPEGRQVLSTFRVRG